MVRPPSYDSNGMKKGAWSEDEDNKLRDFILTYGHSNWRLLPKYAGLKRCGKSCRLRWVNHLKPGVKRGNFSKEEEDLIIKLHAQMGNKWSAIAAELPGRTDNDIKNFWHTRVSRKRNPNSSADTQPPPPPPPPSSSSSSSVDYEHELLKVAPNHQADAASLIETHESMLTFDQTSSLLQSQIGSWADDTQNYAAFPPWPLIDEEFYYPQFYCNGWVGDEDHSTMFGAFWDDSFASNASDYQLQNRACIPLEEGVYDPVFCLWSS